MANKKPLLIFFVLKKLEILLEKLLLNSSGYFTVPNNNFFELSHEKPAVKLF